MVILCADHDLTYEEDAGYGHTWDYWDLKIQCVLSWMIER